MRVIYKRTLQETLRLSFLILTLVAGFLGGLAVGRGSTYEVPTSYDYHLNSSLIMQHFVAFFLVCGVVLMVIVSACGSGLIAGEVHEGTFRILVAKPNSRTTILLAKVLGMLTGSIILMVLGISTMYLTTILSGSLDAPIAKAMLAYFPGYLLYGAIVTLFFGSLSTLLSCIAKKRVVALLPMLLIIALVLIVPVVLRIVLMLKNIDPTKLGYVDLNYHFGSIFRWCMDLCGGITGTSGQLEVPTLLMNIFKQTSIDRDLTRTYDYGFITTNNNTVPVMILLCVYGGLTVINYLASFAIIRKKDV